MLPPAGRGSAARTVAANVVAYACAASAGIHAGIVPEHLREEPRLGVAFVITVVLLVATCATVALRPDRVTALAAALLLAGVICAYIASRTTGIPALAPDPESVDGVGIAAVAIELVGLTCALWLARPIRRRRRRPIPQEVPR